MQVRSSQSPSVEPTQKPQKKCNKPGSTLTRNAASTRERGGWPYSTGEMFRCEGLSLEIWFIDSFGKFSHLVEDADEASGAGVDRFAVSRTGRYLPSHRVLDICLMNGFPDTTASLSQHRPSDFWTVRPNQQTEMFSRDHVPPFA